MARNRRQKLKRKIRNNIEQYKNQERITAAIAHEYEGTNPEIAYAFIVLIEAHVEFLKAYEHLVKEL